MTDIVVPQLVVNSRMIHFGWVPAAPDAVDAAVPAGLAPLANRQVFMHQYVVDDAGQTSGLDAYSLTCLGAELIGTGPADRANGARWWTHYFGSTEQVRDQAAQQGAPVAIGRTTIETKGQRLIAITEADGVEVIRTVAQVSGIATEILRGQLRYYGQRAGEILGSTYPFVAESVERFEIELLEFPEPDHPVYALRPANPFRMMWGFYLPRASFALSQALSVSHSAGR